MWKPEHRRTADHRGLRYPSDLTDTEWALVEPMIPPAKRRRAPARGQCPRGSEPRLLRAFDRSPVAGAAEGPATQEHGALLLHAVGLGWRAGAPPPRALCCDTRAGGARGESNGRDHRKPERQGRSKGGSTLDPQGFDAGKKSLAASGGSLSTR
jgi:hypothetical protein